MEPDFSEAGLRKMAQPLFDAMAKRVSVADLEKIERAYEFARKAHAPQRRKSGEPYIIHPIAVARIVGEEMELGTNPVCAAFLHDVVEDTPYTVDDIRREFGDDVAFLVKVVTKTKKEAYEHSKQVDNFRQMLDSVKYDIRALLVKLADRLHNMRTLASMRPEKQMKIAGETEYFYAPLAHRLGLYKIKTELENLGLKYRCPREYDRLEKLLAVEKQQIGLYLGDFKTRIMNALTMGGIKADVGVFTRKPYSIRKKMLKDNVEFHHLDGMHVVRIVYDTPDDADEKETALKIYSLLTKAFEEKPHSLSNFIDHPKENGYQSLHLKLLASNAHWQEVHICSRRMDRVHNLGLVADRTDANIRGWIDKLKHTLHEISSDAREVKFMDGVKASFYNDDIKVFAIDGSAITLPKGSTALDFAFEVYGRDALRAQYATINGVLSPVKTRLTRGDLVKIGTDPHIRPDGEWLNNVVSFKAKRLITEALKKQPEETTLLCPHCHPIPGDEVIGFNLGDGRIELHKRECLAAISRASQDGDSVVAYDFKPDKTLYPVTVHLRAIDRFHLLSDIINCISDELGLSIRKLSIETADNIVTCTLTFGVHCYDELQRAIVAIDDIKGVEEAWGED